MKSNMITKLTNNPLGNHGNIAQFESLQMAYVFTLFQMSFVNSASQASIISQDAAYFLKEQKTTGLKPVKEENTKNDKITVSKAVKSICKRSSSSTLFKVTNELPTYCFKMQPIRRIREENGGFTVIRWLMRQVLHG